MMEEDELRTLGEDIATNGLKEPIVFWCQSENEPDEFVLDGRNRLEAMELVGCPVPRFWRKLCCGTDPYAYVISKNIHRRHLTKEQQAYLIVEVLKKREEAAKENELANVARSFSPSPGQRGGSTLDQFKKTCVALAAPYGISKRTVERALARHFGPVNSRRQIGLRDTWLIDREIDAIDIVIKEAMDRAPDTAERHKLLIDIATLVTKHSSQNEYVPIPARAVND
jgi:hypothetical protein